MLIIEREVGPSVVGVVELELLGLGIVLKSTAFDTPYLNKITPLALAFTAAFESPVISDVDNGVGTSSDL